VCRCTNHHHHRHAVQDDATEEAGRLRHGGRIRQHGRCCYRLRAGVRGGGHAGHCLLGRADVWSGQLPSHRYNRGKHDLPGRMDAAREPYQDRVRRHAVDGVRVSTISPSPSSVLLPLRLLSTIEMRPQGLLFYSVRLASFFERLLSSFSNRLSFIVRLHVWLVRSFGASNRFHFKLSFFLGGRFGFDDNFYISIINCFKSG
jgi:hypothetical protein